MARQSGLSVRFWGVRGSHPTPGPSTVEIGGNSSCVEVRAGEHTLVFDAGTGLISLGRELMQRKGEPIVHLFLSHLHHDHIEGLRFFGPAYAPDWTCHIYGPEGVGANSLERVLRRVMSKRLFPVDLSQLSARLEIRQLARAQRFKLKGKQPVEITTRLTPAHPREGVTLFRIDSAGRSIVYATDVELERGGYADVSSFARNADILIHDAQYTDEEYHGSQASKAGWGHSTVRQAAEIAKKAGVGQLILFHHDPSHDDAEVRSLEALAKGIFRRSRAAIEGLELQLAPAKR